MPLIRPRDIGPGDAFALRTTTKGGEMRYSLRQRIVLPALTMGALLVTVLLFAQTAGAGQAAPPAPDFGSNVVVFDPSMPTSQIQATVDSIAAQQVDNEMGSQRYALLFEPGTYGSVANPLIIQVGYYTEVAGLGASPADVVINGHVDVYNRCLAPDNCIALNNFWRSVSNLTINVTACPAVGHRATSGRSRRRRRCAASTSPAGT